MERSVAKQSKAKHCLLRAGPTAGQQQGPPCRAAKMPCVVPFLLPSILRCCPQHPPTDITPAPSGGFAVDEWSDGASMTEHHEWSRHTERAAYKLTHEAQHRHNCRTSQHLCRPQRLGSRISSGKGTQHCDNCLPHCSAALSCELRPAAGGTHIARTICPRPPC